MIENVVFLTFFQQFYSISIDLTSELVK